MSPAPDYWTVAAGVYALAFVVCAMSLGPAGRGPDAQRAGYLALLGAGLFSYFVGRSHHDVFLLAAWPAFVLPFVLVDRAETAFAGAQHRVGVVCCRVASALALAVACVVLASSANGVARLGRARWIDALDSSSPSTVRQDASFIARRSTPGEPVVLFADNQATLLALAGRRAATPGPGLIETVLRSDAEKVISYVAKEGPRDLFFSRALLTSETQTIVFEPWVRNGFARMVERYELADEGPEGRITHYVRKP